MASKVRNDEIYEILRSRIYTGKLSSGSVLVENELAQEFSLSRTPIRQVLQRLAIDQLIETRNGVGTHVTSEDLPGMANDIYCCKELLRSSSMLVVVKIDQDSAFDLSGLSSVVTNLDLDNSLEMLWLYYSKMGRLVTKQIDHDILSNAIRLLFGKIFRQIVTSPEIDTTSISALAVDEYATAKKAGYPKDLIDARVRFISKIEKMFPT